MYIKNVFTSKWREGNVLCWGRGFVYVSTGKEKQWIPSKMIKIRYDRGRPLEGLSYRQEKENKKNDRNNLGTELQTHQDRICNSIFFWIAKFKWTGDCEWNSDRIVFIIAFIMYSLLLQDKEPFIDLKGIEGSVSLWTVYSEAEFCAPV